MTSGKENIGEQPIFTCSAHVFHIDPKTKRTWITASTKSVSVSFFYDSSRNLYRIISVEGSKAVINSTITPNMTFTQTSQKFGQWSDVRANTVYGLGFSSESELTKFVEKFQEVKEATKNALAKNTANNGSAPNANSTGATPITSANTSPVTGRSTSLLQAASDANNADLVDPPLSIQNLKIQDPSSPSHKPLAPVVSAGSASCVAAVQAAADLKNQPILLPPDTTAAQQLKYENERLKLALAQSSANAKNWEIELTTLRNNNIRLTSALQESTANVDEWKRQLSLYKEENLKMKSKLQEMTDPTGGGQDSGSVNCSGDDMRKEIILLKSRIESLEGELKGQELELKAANKNLKDKNNDPAMKQLLTLTTQFAKHLNDMKDTQKEMEKILHNSKST